MATLVRGMITPRGAGVVAIRTGTIIIRPTVGNRIPPQEVPAVLSTARGIFSLGAGRQAVAVGIKVATPGREIVARRLALHLAADIAPSNAVVPIDGMHRMVRGFSGTGLVKDLPILYTIPYC